MKNRSVLVILFFTVLSLLFSNPTNVGARIPDEDSPSENEITDTCPPIQNTPFFTIVYGSVTLNGSQSPIGSLVKAYSPRNDLVGCFAVTTAGSYGAMYIYGEDTSVVPSIPGMRNNEPVSFTINDLPATTSPVLLWANDKDLHAVNLVSQGVTANFSATPVSGLNPLVVQFTDGSAGTITSRQWDFGDGQTSTELNPQHTYATPGSYTVSLTVNGPAGSDVESKINYISVYSEVISNFSADRTSGISPLAVSFTNSSTGSYTSLFWNFGDGGTSTSTNPTHTYTAGGMYTVSLTASGPGGTDTETKINYITVYTPVVAGFTSTPTSGVVPLTVNFTNTSTGSYTNLTWDFGDGGTSTATNPSHLFTSSGTYTVVLTASGLGGTSQATSVIYVYVPAVASFSASPTSGIAPLNVTFTNSSSGDFSSLLWNFGDGNTSSEINPVHYYSSSGVFTVSLTVTGLGGTDSEVKTDHITVYSPTEAQFSGSPTSGIAPLSVSFTNLSSGDFTSQSWTFGDGANSELFNPVHEYVTSGTYTVSLSVNGPGGLDQEIKTNYITVYDPVNTDFSAAPTTGIGPLEVAFTNLSTGSYDGFTWDFGDGNTSNETNPVHIYMNKGVYTVTLTASGPGGIDQEVRGDYITVYQVVAAAFNSEDIAGVAPHTAQFTNLTTGDYDTLAWDFGDGSTSVEANPSHIYTAAGTYTVSLTASGNGGTDVETKTAYITVYSPIVAEFTYTPASGIAPLEVQFTNASTGDYDTLVWDFGDGSSSTETNPTHVFASGGTYAVTLTASGLGGEDIQTHTVEVYTAVNADFSADVTSGIAPLTLQFMDLSTGDYDTWLWDFGDGSSSAIMNPTYLYSNPGIYTVTLTVAGDGGSDTETKINYITIYTPVSADFSADVTSGIAPLTVQFTDLSTGDYGALAWDFGDGNTSVEANPSHVYTVAGTYTVTLTVSGDGGTDVETKTAYITVYTAVHADFSADVTSGIAPLTVQFTDLSTGDYGALAWDFGDGATSAETSPTHVYTAAGTYTVSLTVTGDGGTDGETKTAYITVYTAVHADFSADVTSGIAPLTVQFTDLSTGDYDTLAWDFGDGGSSGEANPTHVYTDAGTYTVSLTITGDGGTDGETKTAYITVYTAVHADFSADVTSGIAPLTVQFTDLSTGDYDTLAWDFGDGSTSNEQNPTHIFVIPGNYVVVLTVTGPGGTDSAELTIQVNPFTLYLPLILR